MPKEKKILFLFNAYESKYNDACSEFHLRSHLSQFVHWIVSLLSPHPWIFCDKKLIYLTEYVSKKQWTVSSGGFGWLGLSDTKWINWLDVLRVEWKHWDSIDIHQVMSKEISSLVARYSRYSKCYIQHTWNSYFSFGLGQIPVLICVFAFWQLES